MNAPFRWLLIASWIGAFAASSWADAPKLALLPVEGGKIILKNKCERGSRPQWNETTTRRIGLARGEKVLVITSDGLLPATLGRLSCLAEGCGGNYWSIDLVPDRSAAGGAMLAAVRDAAGRRLQPVALEIGESAERCSAVLSGVAPDPRVANGIACKTVTIRGKEVLTLAVRGRLQENGYPIYLSKAQVSGTSAWTEIDEDTDPLMPVAAFADQQGQELIVWRKASGLCCPRAVTVRTSSVRSGKLSLGPAFTAGGQPCD